MKVSVTLKMKSSKETDTVVELTVGETEVAASVKDRVTSAQLIPFPKQDLVFNDKIIDDDTKLSDCDVKDGSALDLVVSASEEDLVQQLSELLQARDLSADELGLLYCYKHGVSINQALKVIGHEGKLQDFVAKQKVLVVENGNVTLVRPDTSLRPFSVVSEIEQLLKATESGTMDIKELCSKFVKKFGVSLSSIVGTRPVEFLAREKKVFNVHGRGQVSLKSMQKQKQASAIMAPPGLTPGADSGEPDAVDSEQYLELHTRICSRTFNSRVTKILNDIVNVVSEAVFLNIAHVVSGGSVGKTIAISGGADAEIVLFVNGLPAAGHSKWLPPLLRSVAGALSDSFNADDHFVQGVRVTDEAIKMDVKGLDSVHLYISPTFKSYAKTIQVLGEQGPDARMYYSPALAKERSQFIARQPSQVKVTMRLAKWWRDQQEWSSKLVRPSDNIMELMAVYSAIQTKPTDQKVAIANLMSLLSRFDQMRIVWSNYYTKDDVWAPLLRQRPLLMDPTNPFINVADPQCFDARELMALARTTHFFW